MPERLLQEQSIAKESFSSSASFEVVERFISFPKNVQGLSILDIGGGASTAIIELRGGGAYAYSIDYLYTDMKSLKRSVDRYLTKPNFSERAPTQNQVAEGLQELRKEVPPGTDPRLWSIAADLTERMLKDPRGQSMLTMRTKREAQSNQVYVKQQRRARDKFFGSLDRGYNYYIAALAGQLPFRDNTFDISYSLQTISFFLIRNRDVFMGAIAEALRVTKPGGELQLHPWMGNLYNPWPEDWSQRVEETHLYFHERGIQYRIEPTSPISSPLLRVIKPKQ